MTVYPRKFLAPALCLALGAANVLADSKEMIDTGSQQALARLRQQSPEAAAMVDRAVAALVFPDVVKMGFGSGGKYGEGSLLVKGQPVAYYVTAGSNYGLQQPAHAKSEIILFFDEKALQEFRGDVGWVVGVDGRVTVPATSIDTTQVDGESMIGFVFSDEDLAPGSSLEGSKITPIAR